MDLFSLMIKNILKNFLNNSDIYNIEAALVQSFLNCNGIEVKKNEVIKDILSKKNQEIEKIKTYLELQNFKLNLDDLIKAFELLIPRSDKKINGAFFTPSNITHFIVKNTITKSDSTVCDPSCGCGAFLTQAADYIHHKFSKKFKDIFENNLFGVDILEYSIRRCKVLLSLLALKNGEDITNPYFNIYKADSLNNEWAKLFPKIIAKGGFDVVIGNPPYVKFQDLLDQTRTELYKNWKTLKKGTYNLYFAFFELGIKILNKDGVLGFITPNNYFTSLAGVYLRQFLSDDHLLYKILDFNHLKLFEAQTYTCVTFLKRNGKDFFYYERIDSSKDLEQLGSKEPHYSEILFSDLDNKKWRLLKSRDQENIKKIENTYIKLGEITDIKVGVATCKDNVYFIDGDTLKNGYYVKHYQGKNYLIEAAATKPIVKISDFKNQAGLKENRRRIIFPYKKINGAVELISSEEMESKFPKCYEFLAVAKDELLERDKGKTLYPEWYAYARTQGLNLYGKKLLTPTFSSGPRFLYERSSDSLFCNGYAIYPKREKSIFMKELLDLEIIKKILNSVVMDYYINKTSVSIGGGYACYQKNFIELFGVPRFTNKEIIKLKMMTDKQKIDKFLTKKYDLRLSVEV